MKKQNFIGVSGHIVITNALTGEIVYEGDNHVTDVGLGWIADQCSDAGEAAISHVAVGTGVLNNDGTDTALATELARVAITSNTQTTTSFTVAAQFPAGTGTGTLTEVGMFNDASAGTLIAAKVINIGKEATDAYNIYWTITFTRAA